MKHKTPHAKMVNNPGQTKEHTPVNQSGNVIDKVQKEISNLHIMDNVSGALKSSGEVLSQVYKKIEQPFEEVLKTVNKLDIKQLGHLGQFSNPLLKGFLVSSSVVLLGLTFLPRFFPETFKKSPLNK